MESARHSKRSKGLVRSVIESEGDAFEKYLRHPVATPRIEVTPVRDAPLRVSSLRQSTATQPVRRSRLRSTKRTVQSQAPFPGYRAPFATVGSRQPKVVTHALETMAPADAVAYYHFQLLWNAFTSWKNYTRTVIDSREAALRKWLISVSFWEHYTLSKIFNQWRRVRVLPQLQLKVAVSHHRESLLTKGLVGFAVNMHSTRYHKQRLYLAVSFWARHIESRCLRSWRRFAADKMDSVLFAMPVRSAGMMAALFQWIHLALQVHVLAHHPHELLLTSHEAASAVEDHRSFHTQTQGTFAQTLNIQHFGVNSTSLLVRQDWDSFEGDSHIGALVPLVPTERRRRVLAECVAAVDRRFVKFLFYIWRVKARRVTVFRIRCLRRQVRDRLDQWRSAIGLYRKEKSRYDRVEHHHRVHVLGQYFARWQSKRRAGQRLQNIAHKAARVHKLVVCRKFIAVWKDALARKSMYHLAMKHQVRQAASRFIKRLYKYAQKRQVKRQMGYTADSFWFRVTGRGTLTKWLNQLDHSRKVAQAVARWQNMAAYRCFQQLMAYREIRIWKQELALTADQHYSQSLVHRVMRTWKGEVEHQQVIGGVLKSALLQRFGRMQHACFISWREFAIQRKEKRIEVALKLKNFALHKAFSTWSERILSTIETRRQLEAAKRELSLFRLGQCLDVWRTKLHHKNIIRRVHAAIAMREVRSAFKTWHESVDEVKRQRELVKRSLARMLNRTASLCFSGWHKVVVSRKNSEAAFDIISTRHVEYTKKRILRYWRHEQLESDRREQIFKKVTSRIVNRRLAMAFSRWSENVDEIKHNRAALKKAYARWNMGLLSRTFQRWKQWVVDTQYERQNLQKAVGKWNQGLLSKCFTRWIENVVEQQEMRDKINKAFGIWTNTAMAKAFSRWRTNVVEIQRDREALRKAVACFAHSKLSQAFRTWFDNASTQKQERMAVQKAVKIWQNKSLATMFRTWQEYVYLEFKERELIDLLKNNRLYRATIAWRDVATEQHTNRKALAYWLNSSLARAFATWKENVAELKRQREVLARAARRLLNLKIARAFNKWNGYYELQLYKKEIVVAAFEHAREFYLRKSLEQWQRMKLFRVCGRRILYGRAHAAFRSWWEWTLQHSSKAKRRAELITKVQKRVGNRLIEWGFLKLYNHAQEIKRMRSVITMLNNGKLLRSFNSWRVFTDNCLFLKQKEEELTSRHNAKIAIKSLDKWRDWTHKHQVMYHFAAVLANRGVARAFSTWWEYTRRRLVTQDAFDEYCTRSDERSLQKSFDKWRDAAHIRGRLAFITQIWRGRNLQTTFEAWCRYVVDRRRQRAKDYQNQMSLADARLVRYLNTWREELRKKVVVRNCLLRISSRSVGVCFHAWLSYTRKRQENFTMAFDAADKAFQKWGRRDLIAAFNQWKAFTMDARAEKETIRKAMDIWQGNQLATNFRRWREFVECAQEERENIGHAMRHWQNIIVSRAFNTWKDNVGDLVYQKGVMQKAVARWGQMVVARSFSVWVEFTESRREQKQAVAKALGHWQLQAAGRCFVQWRENVRSIIEDRSAMTKAASIWANRNLAIAFRTWQDNVSAQIHERELLAKAAARWANQKLAGSFEHWVNYVEGQRIKSERVEQADENWNYVVVTRAFHSWRKAKFVRTCARRILYFRVNAALNSWREYAAFKAQQRVRRQDLLEQAFFNTREKLMKKGMDAFVRNHAESTQMKHVMGILLQSRIARAFNSWKMFTNYRSFYRQTAIDLDSRIRELHLERYLSKWRAVLHRRTVMQHFVARLANRHLAMAFDTWSTFARHRAAETEAFELVLSNSQARQKQKIIDSWRNSTDLRIRLSHITAIWRGRDVEACFGAWRKYAATQKRKSVQLAQGTYRTEDRILRKFLARWQTELAKKSKLHAAIVHFAGKSLVMCFSAWKKLVHGARARWVQVEEYGRKREHRVKEMCFARWISITNESKQGKHAIDRALRMWQNRTLAHFFVRWIEFVANAKHEREVLDHVKKRWMNRRETAVWNQWTAYHDHRVRKAELVEAADAQYKEFRYRICFEKWDRMLRLRIAARRLMNRALLSAFSSWKQYAMERSEKHQKRVGIVSTVVKRYRERRERMIFDALHQNWQENVSLRQAVAVMQHAKAARAFNSWRDFVDHKLYYQQTYDTIYGNNRARTIIKTLTIWREWAHKRHVMNMFVVRMQKRGMAAAFDSWIHMTRRRLAAVDAFDEYCAMDRERTLNKHMDKWRAVVDLRSRLRYITAIWHGRDLQTTFEGWHRYTIDCRRKRAKDIQNQQLITEVKARKYLEFWREALVKRVKLRDAMMHFHFKCAHQVFLAWRQYAVKSKEQMEIAAEAFGFKMDKLASKYFQRWVEWVQEEKNTKALQRRAVLRLQQVKVAAAFSTWKENVQEIVVLRRAVELIRGRSDKKRLSDAFSQWQISVAEQKSVKAKYIRAVALSSEKKLSQSFRVWFDFIAQKKKLQRILMPFLSGREEMSKQMHFKAWKHYAGTRRNRAAAVDDFRTRADYLYVVRRWYKKAMTNRHHKNLLERFSRQWQNRSLAAAFRAWHYKVERRAWDMQLSKEVQDIVNGNLMVRAVRLWREEADLRVRLGACEEQLVTITTTRLALRTLARWRERTEFSLKARQAVALLWGKRRRAMHAECFTAWKNFVLRKQDKEKSVKRALQFWHNAQLRSAWNTWIEFIDEMDRRKRIMRRAMMTMRNAELMYCFDIWKGVVEQGRANKAAALAFLERTDEGRLRASLTRWREWVAEQQHRQLLLQKAVVSFKNRQMRSSFSSWWHVTSSRMRLEDLFDEFTLRQKSRIRHNVLSMWSADAKRRQAAMLLCGNKLEVRVKQMIKDWHKTTQRLVVTRERGMQLLGSTIRKIKVKAIKVWIEESQKKVKLRRAMMRWQHAQLSLALESWREYLQQCREARADRFRHNQLVGKPFRAWSRIKMVMIEYEEQKNEAAVIGNRNTIKRWLWMWHDRAVLQYRVRYLLGNNQALELKTRFARWRWFTSYRKSLSQRAEYVYLEHARTLASRTLRIWQINMLVTRHFRASITRRAFNAWNVHTTAIGKYRRAILKHRHALVQLEQSLRRSQYNNVFGVFRAWKRGTLVPADHWELARKFERKVLLGKLLVEWRRWSKRKAAEKAKIRTFVRERERREFKQMLFVWRETMYYQQELKSKVGHFVKDKMTGGMVSALKGWHTYARAVKKARIMQVNRFRALIEKWRSATQESLKIQSAQKSISLALRRHVYEKWRRKYTHAVSDRFYTLCIARRVLRLWYDTVEEEKKMKIAEEHETFMVAAKHFSLWRLEAEESRAMIHYNRKLIVKSLRAWNITAKRSIGLHRVVGLIKYFVVGNQMRLVFGEWKRFSSNAQQRRSKIIKELMGNSRQRTLEDSFAAWRSFTKSRGVLVRQLEMRGSMKSERRDRRKMLICFQRWRKHASLRKAIFSFVERWESRKFKLAFREWAHWSGNKTLTQWRILAAQEYYMRRKVAMGFFGWRMLAKATQWALVHTAKDADQLRRLDNVMVHTSVSLGRLTEGIRALSPLSYAAGSQSHVSILDNVDEEEEWAKERALMRDQKAMARKSLHHLPQLLGSVVNGDVITGMIAQRSEGTSLSSVTSVDRNQLRKAIAKQSEELSTLKDAVMRTATPPRVRSGRTPLVPDIRVHMADDSEPSQYGTLHDKWSPHKRGKPVSLNDFDDENEDEEGFIGRGRKIPVQFE